MRLFPIFLLPLALCLCVPALAQLNASPAQAPGGTQPMPPADPYTVTGIVIDMPVASAQEARDIALLAAERQALQKLREQLTASGATATIPEPNDKQLARMVQNFEVANERISAKRYSGSFTIRFRGHAVAQAATEMAPVTQAAVATSSLVTLYRFTSLPQWSAMQQRLLQSGVVRSVDMLAIGRGYVQVALNYNGSVDGLNNALGAQGIRLQEDTTGWVLTGTQGL